LSAVGIQTGIRVYPTQILTNNGPIFTNDRLHDAMNWDCIKLVKKDISVRGSIVFSLTQQTFLLVLSAMLVDGGRAFQGSVYALVAYWIGFLIIMVRRRRSLTQADKLLIRWGYVMLWIVSPLVTTFVWSLR